MKAYCLDQTDRERPRGTDRATRVDWVVDYKQQNICFFLSICASSALIMITSALSGQKGGGRRKEVLRLSGARWSGGGWWCTGVSRGRGCERDHIMHG